MSRSMINFCVDGALALAYTGLATIVLVTHVVFPSGSQAEDASVFGESFTRWRDMEATAFALFTLLLLLHLILHWTWVCGFLAARLSKRWGRKITLHDSAKTIWGVSTLILVFTLIGALVLAAELSLRNAK